MAAVAPPPAAMPATAASPVTVANDSKTEAADEKPTVDKAAAAASSENKEEQADGDKPKDEQGDAEAKSPKNAQGARETSAAASDERPRATSGNRSLFDLEPNPFEQSFSQGQQPGAPQSSDRTTPPRGGDATSVKHNALPPLSSLTSPAAADPSKFPWLAGHSLRSGPLSPAMLAGPAQGSQAAAAAAAATSGNGAAQAAAAPNANQAWGPTGDNPEAAAEGNYEPGNFRTGFTPGTGTGFTPGYNALLNSNFGTLPMPSPNTAAFLNSITNVNDNNDANAASGGPANGGDNRQPQAAIPPHLQQAPHGMSHLNPAHSAPQETITPNTLSALTSAVNADLNRSQGAGPMQQQPFYPPNMGAPPGMAGGMPPVDYAQQNANAASQAANGLFLLSQAHQELSKREEEAKSGGTPLMNKRTSVGAAPPGSGKAPTTGQKRKEPATKSAGKKGKKASKDGSADEDDKEDKKSSRGETEEEKRKNFLERNRQAALKCRQRKKAWLSELQNKVETLSMENERLNHTVRQMEDEINRLSTILMQHRDCGVGVPAMAPAYPHPLR